MAAVSGIFSQLLEWLDWSGILLILLILPVTRYIWARITSNLPPGPTPLPLIGNYFTFSNKSLPMYEELRRVAPKYGNVMTIYMGPMPFVVLNNYESVKRAFMEQSEDFAGRPFSLTGEVFSEGNNDIVMSDFGPRWVLHRRLMMVALKKFADKNTIMDLILESTNDVCERMIKECEGVGKVKNVKSEIYLIIYNVISSILFSIKFADDEDEEFKMLRRNVDRLNNFFSQGFLADTVPALKFLPTPRKTELIRMMDGILAFFQRNIEEHKRSVDEQNPRDITDHILITKSEMEREGKEDMSMLSDLHVRQTLSDIFLAGTDTTAFTLLWTILYCIHYPELQEKAFQEIERVVGTRMITVEDKRELSYTDAFMLEAMRIRPIVPLAVPHTPSSSKAKLYGYHITNGVNVVPNIWACHHDSQYWENPEEFKPERFIDSKTGKAIPKPESFIPFGVGRRACAGEHLARVDTFLVFASILQKLKLCKVKAGVSRQEALEPDASVGPLLCMPKPYEIRVERR